MVKVRPFVDGWAPSMVLWVKKGPHFIEIPKYMRLGTFLLVKFEISRVGMLHVINPGFIKTTKERTKKTWVAQTWLGGLFEIKSTDL